MQLINKKWSEESFLEERKAVLATWPTGKDVDLDEAIEYQRSIPQEKRFQTKLEDAIKKDITLLQPRAGVPLVDAHIKLLRYLETEGGADLLPTTIDAYTRLNRYKDAEHGIKESEAHGKAMLNGFPAVNHGVAACRKVTSSVNSPVQVRHGTPDARLLAENTLAGGITSFEGG
ncbi:MAG: methylaspartate mutase subunit E, partial [Clostridiales bacterium]|nr:methylaspartate mutase subunit E [Clostridiales bacterium]